MLGSGAIVVMATPRWLPRVGGSSASSPARVAASARRAARAPPGWSGSCTGFSTATGGPTNRHAARVCESISPASLAARQTTICRARPLGGEPDRVRSATVPDEFAHYVEHGRPIEGVVRHAIHARGCARMLTRLRRPRTTWQIHRHGHDRRGRPRGAARAIVIEACGPPEHTCRAFATTGMTPVGMCRQCLVEIEGPRGPMMVVSCMTSVVEGQVVHTATDSVKRAQEGVLELFLANHPLDCPVCDKGGECPLQDQTLTHGPGESRYVEQKRHFEKPIPISDLVRSIASGASCAIGAPASPTRSPATADPLRQPRQRHPGDDIPRRAVRVVLLGQTCRSAPSARSPPRHTGSGQAVGSRAGREHVHDVFSRMPSRDPVEPRRVAALPGRRLRPGQLGVALRPWPVRLPGGQLRPTPRGAARAWRIRPRRDVVERCDRSRGDARARGPRRRRVQCDRTAWRCAGHQRGCVRLGQARRRFGPRPPRCADGGWIAGGRARPRSGDHRRGRQRVHDRLFGPISKRSCRCFNCGCATPPRSDAARVLEFSPIGSASPGSMAERPLRSRVGGQCHQCDDLEPEWDGTIGKRSVVVGRGARQPPSRRVRDRVVGCDAAAVP